MFQSVSAKLGTSFLYNMIIKEKYKVIRGHSPQLNLKIC